MEWFACRRWHERVCLEMCENRHEHRVCTMEECRHSPGRCAVRTCNKERCGQYRTAVGRPIEPRKKRSRSMRQREDRP